MRAFPHRGHHQRVTLGRGGCWSRSDQAIRRRSDAALESIAARLPRSQRNKSTGDGLKKLQKQRDSRALVPGLILRDRCSLRNLDTLGSSTTARATRASMRSAARISSMSIRSRPRDRSHRGTDRRASAIYGSDAIGGRSLTHLEIEHRGPGGRSRLGFADGNYNENSVYLSAWAT